MITGPKYKIARRLGVPIFEKTQSQKFLNSVSRKRKSMDERPRAKTAYGLQMLEKQKARFSYGVGERQFKRYVEKALSKKGGKPDQLLFRALEMRLDNVVYRLSFGTTRLFSRQLVSHGHITVNGKRVTIPSFTVSSGDKIRIREGSRAKPVFRDLDTRLKSVTAPAWIKFESETKEGEIVGEPRIEGTALVFNLESILDFYRR